MIYINIKRDEPIFQVRRVDRGINIHSMGKRGLQGDTGVQGMAIRSRQYYRNGRCER